MKSFFYPLVVATVLSPLTSCKSASRSTAKTKDLSSVTEATAGCACADTQCWNTRIQAYQIDSAKCAIITLVTAINPLLGAEVPKLLECTLSLGVTAHDVYSKINTCRDIGKQRNEGNPIAMNDIIGCAFSGATPLGVSITSCIEGAAHVSVGVAMSVIGCGLTVAQGGTLFVGDTGCLMSDIYRAYSSRPNLDPNAPIVNNPNAAAGTCNGQDINCAYTPMERYGRWLYQNGGTFIFSSRAAYCAKKCSNGPEARTSCEQALSQDGFFAPDACKQVCSVAQCRNAIEYCVSACCGKDGDCTTEAAGYLQ